MTKPRTNVTRSVGCALALLLALGGAVLVRAQASVTLAVSASPAAGQPGITTITLTGANFPAGTITAAATIVTLQPVTTGSGPTISTSAASVVTVSGTTRRVTFTVPPGISVANPTPYRASIAGQTSTGISFISSNSAALTVNPPPRIQSLAPASADLSSTPVTVTITTAFTNFVQGATSASFGPGISVGGAAAGGYGPVTVTSPTTATAQLVIGESASAGFHHVSVRTGVQEASVDGMFSVSVPNRPPTANAGAAVAGIVGQPVTFDGRSSSDPDGDPLTFSWQFGDGQTGDGPTPSHTYSTAGQFVVTLTVRDNRGGEDSASTSAQIAPANRQPIAQASGPASGDEGSPLAFSSAGSGDPDGDALTYEWTFGDGTAPSTLANPSHSFAQAGDYTVTLTVRDPAGLTATATVAVAVRAINRQPIAQASGPASGDAGSPLAFSSAGSSDPDGDALTYEWNFGDNTAPSTLANASHSFAQAGDYTVTLTVRDPAGLMATATVTVTVRAVNRQPIAQASGPASGDAGSPLAFSSAGSSDPDGDALTYEWNFGDNTPPSTQPNPSHAFAQPGNYTVTLTVTDSGNLTATATVTVIVNPVNRKPTAVPGGPYAGQRGNAIAFDGSASSDPDGDAITFSWNFGDNSAPATTAEPSHTYTVAGTFTVTLTVTDSHGASDTALVTVAVTGVNATPTANPGGPYSGEAGVAITFDGSQSSDPDGPPLTYVWDFGDGTPAGSGARPSHVFANEGTYPVTLTVTDPAGASHTASTSSTVTRSVDRIPPIVTLTAAKQALPGTQVMVTADATDNVAVSTVTIDVNGADPVSFATPPYQRLVTLPDVVAPGTVTEVRATAIDPSGNQGRALAAITIVAQPDTTRPTIAVSVPPQAAAGTSIRVTADANDDVGVTGVEFSANTTPIGSASTAPYQVTYVVSADAPVGAILTFAADAVDAAGNRARATATLTVVSIAEADHAPPLVALTAPPTVVAGTSFTATATATDASGIASVTFLVDAARIGLLVSAPYQAHYTVPPTAVPGTRLRVEAQAVDGVGLDATAGADVIVVAPSEGILTGAVLDDATGLPLSGATVSLTGQDARGIPYTQTTLSDSRGQYVLSAVEGQGTIRVAKTGFTALARDVTIQSGSALRVVDARPTSTGAITATIAAAAGGTVTGSGLPLIDVWQRDLLNLSDPYVTTLAASAPSVSLTVPAGSLASDATVNLTAVSRQGLAGLLPAGWTPIATVDMAPHGVAFAVPASLTLPLPMKLAAGTQLTIARWDDTARAWRAVSGTSIAAGATTLTASIESSGQLAWLLADVVPQPPPSPADGDLLRGVETGLIPSDVTAVVDPQPRIIFYKPGVKSDVRGRVTTSTPLSSGTLARTRIVESYDFFSGAHMQLDPALQDVVLFQVPGTDGRTLLAGYPVAPSLTFEALSLQKGVIGVELRAPGALQETLDAIGPSGGSVTSPSGERIDVASGASSGPLPVVIRSLAAGEIGVPAPDGFEIVGAAFVDFANVLAVPATLSVSRAAQVRDDDLVVVARMQELIGQTRFVIVGLATVAADRVSSTTTLAGSDATFDGVRLPGRYVFLRAAAPAAFAAGLVRDTGSLPFAGAVVAAAPTAALVAVSHTGGRYVLVIPIGGAALTARDPIVGDSADGVAHASTARQIVPLDFTLAAHFPAVARVTPQNGAEGVPLSGPLVVTFTTPIDPASATADSFVLRSAAGVVEGRREFSNGNTVVTFRSTQPLTPDTAYTLTLTTGIADPFGRAMLVPFTTSFTSLDTNAPPPPTAGSISASIPVNGSTTVSVTQGAAGSKDTVLIRNVTRGTLTPISVVDPSVGFTAQVAAGITDTLHLVIRDRSGNETIVAIPVFRTANADGSISQAVTRAGGHIDGPAGIGVTVKPGTFPDGAVVTVTSVDESAFPVPLLTDEQKQHFRFSGGLKLDYGGRKPELYLDVSIPSGPDDNEAERWLVVRQMPYLGETLYDLADTARLIDGRVATSSPPCPGVSAAAVYGFLKVNQEISVLTGAGGVIRNPEALDAAYALAAESVLYDAAGAIFTSGATPGAILSGLDNALSEILIQSTTFCAPVLSGKVTAVPNRMTLRIDPAAFVDADVQLVVKNTSPSHPGAEQRFVRPFPASISIEGGSADPVSVQAIALDGAVRTIDVSNPALVQKLSRSFVAVSVANVAGDYRSIVVENLQTQKQLAEAFSRRPVNAPMVKLLMEGTITDTYNVYAVTSLGVKVPLTASVAPYEAGTGNILFTGLRSTIDPTPAEIDAYNAALPPGAPELDRRGGTVRAWIEVSHRDPMTHELVPAGTVTLLDVSAGINRIADGGFQVSSADSLDSVYRLRVQHLSGVTDEQTLPQFRVTVVNHKTKATVRELLGPIPPKTDTVVINTYGDGSTKAIVDTSLSTFVETDPSSPLRVAFTAPVDRNSALTQVKLLDAFNQPIAGKVVFGNDPLNGVDSVISFVPTNPLPLGKTFTLSFFGVTNLLGAPLFLDQDTELQTITVTTFAPTVLGSYSELNLDGTRIPFDDIQVLKDTDAGGNARVSLLATSSNENGFKLHAIDVTHPAKPVELSQAGGGHRTRRLALQTNATFTVHAPLTSCNAHVTGTTFSGSLALGTASNTDDSSLMFYDVTDPAAVCTLSSKKITTNPSVFGDFQRGTFRILNLGAGGAAFLQTTTGYAAYMAIRQVGIAAVDVKANVPDVPVPERKIEGLYSGDFGDVVAAAGDRLLALNNNYGSGATLDVLDPNLSPVASVAVDNAPSPGGGTQSHQIAYVHDVLVDRNGDGEYDDSEVFAFAYIAGRAGITVVDVTDPDSPAPVTTFPVGLLARQVAVSRDGRRLYVGGAVAGGTDAFYVVDVSNPFAPVTNRIIYTKSYPEIDRIQVDPERPYVYVATTGSIDVIATEAPNLSGTLTYISYNVAPDPLKPGEDFPTAHLNYSLPLKKPIRRAIVELRDASGKVLETTKTDDQGFYAFHAPLGAPLDVVIKAQSGSPITLSVVDTSRPCIGPGLSECQLWTAKFTVTTGTGRLIRDYTAESGWNDASKQYTGARESAPFAILDTALRAQTFVNNEILNITFPPLLLDWSPQYGRSSSTKAQSRDSDDVAHYNHATTTIKLNGLADNDTDEFDKSVIYHEFGHYLQQNFGRDDSLGGAHEPVLDRLDPTVAFSEGFADAFAAMVQGSGFIAQTHGPQQGDGFVLNVEEDNIPDNGTKDGIPVDGFYDELTVAQVLFDLYDDDDPDDLDHDADSTGSIFSPSVDNVHLGFAPLYGALMAQRTTPAFTTIYSFLDALRNSWFVTGGTQGLITALAADENIAPGDAFGATGADVPLYTTITVENAGDAPSPAAGQSVDLFGPITATSAGNKFLNYAYFKFDTTPLLACYSVIVTPAPLTTVVVRQVQPGAPARGEGLTFPVLNTRRTFSYGTHAIAIGALPSSPVSHVDYQVRVRFESAGACP